MVNVYACDMSKHQRCTRHNLLLHEFYLLNQLAGPVAGFHSFQDISGKRSYSYGYHNILCTPKTSEMTCDSLLFALISYNLEKDILKKLEISMNSLGKPLSGIKFMLPFGISFGTYVCKTDVACLNYRNILLGLPPHLKLHILSGLKFCRMLGGVAGRHMSNRRRGSSPAIRAGEEFSPARYARRRRAVTTSDHKSCALIQTRLKLGDIMYNGIYYSCVYNILESPLFFSSINQPFV
ncbi:hypothetical protein NQ317_013711 [Molorchus minor]|uniref:Uncharacterized protein n=1 Tax=Molorchus minor TaxID=1323400 RepID=A0ABQ9IXN0_9CUCU|nr:hypothetical protein NQ317_013711 [Molorchus minor]